MAEVALTVEDGTGVVGAESYVSEIAADTYWGKRTHLALYTTWNAATTAQKEGALREATQFVEAQYGPFYRGTRRGYVQGLLWPRTQAYDGAGYDLPNLPTQLQDAVCELAARAVSSPLASDLERGGTVKRLKEKVGPLETDTEYDASASPQPTYGVVAGILEPILDGSQGGANSATWYWR